VTTRQIAYQLLDTFSAQPFAGNPAGVVLDAEGLAPEDMQRIAAELQAGETAFAGAPAGGRIPLRCFTPSQEVDLGGHAPLGLAVAWALARRAGAEALPAALSLDSRAGPVQAELRPHQDGGVEAGLGLPRPRFADFGYRVELLAGALGMQASQIPSGWPLGLAHAGQWTLVVPAVSPGALAGARPDFAALADLNRKLGCGTTLLYTHTGDHGLSCRGFSPASGVHEAAFSGVAIAAAAALLLKEGSLRKTAPVTRVEAVQGASLGRPGRALVELAEEAPGGPGLRLCGAAVPTCEGRLRLA